MKIASRILNALIAVSLAGNGLAWAGAPPLKERTLVIQAHELTGRDTLARLISGCSAANWTQFKPIARKEALSSWENQSRLDLKVTKDSLASAALGLKMRFHHDGKSPAFEVEWGNVTYRGDDACALLTQMNAAMKPTRKSAALALALGSPAEATDALAERVSEDKDSDRFALTASVVTLGVLAALCWPVGAVGATGWLAYLSLGWMAFGIYSEGKDAIRAYGRYQQKDTFEKMLNTNLSLECSPGLVVIHSGERKIVIRKEWTYSIDVFKNDGSSEPLYTDHDFADIPRSREFLTNIARKCETPEQAQALTAEFTNQVEEAKKQFDSMAATEPSPAAGAATKSIN